MKQTWRVELDEFYTTHADSAKRLAFLLTGDNELAEDITQDAFVKVAGRLGGLRNRASAAGYLRRTVLNLSRDHFRRKKVERTYLQREAGMPRHETFEERDVHAEDALWSELHRLPYRQRCAVVLRYYEDLSEQQTADLLGCSVGAVKALTNRAMEQLRANVGSEARGMNLDQDLRTMLRDRAEGVAAAPVVPERTVRRARTRKTLQTGGALTAIAAVAVIATLVRPVFSESAPPADGPQGPFVGVWLSIDGDGSSQTMTVRVSGDDAVEITSKDDAASVCSGVPSTMVGTGRLEGDARLVIPAPEFTCDDGSEPESLSGPPLDQQLRNLTFTYSPDSDNLTDNLGSIWQRDGSTDDFGLLPEPDEGAGRSGGMWPQSSLAEVREAQRLADEGDPRYTWQVTPKADPSTVEILTRFVREELGWDYYLGPSQLGSASGPGEMEAAFIRCAKGETNPLYPNDPIGGSCAPTIDGFRYETVQINASRPLEQGPSGIWVVDSWTLFPRSEEPVAHTIQDPFGRQAEQVTPPTDAEARAVLREFLEARLDGEGAEGLVHDVEVEIPLLYATTSGATHERYEIEFVSGPVWPTGWMQFKVRLFAEDDDTVVEQYFIVDFDDDGSLGLEYKNFANDDLATTENGRSVPVTHTFLDDEVTFEAAPPWDVSIYGGDTGPTLTTLYSDMCCGVERLRVVADPRPIGNGCQEGPAPADAEALARTIRSDPAFEATTPVAVTIDGVRAVRMDLVAAPGAGACDRFELGGPGVMTDTGLPSGNRMRLYLLDFPGGSAEILAIAYSEEEKHFEEGVESAAPILESFEFQGQ